MIVGVTGQRGVLGKRIARVIQSQGHDIAAFDGDVRSSDGSKWAEGLDRIVHCAAVVPVAQVESNPYNAAETNVLGTLNLARLAEFTRNRHLTYISTSHVYGACARPLAEHDPLEPGSLYGLTKLQGEQWVRALAPRHLIIRVFSFFAEEQNDRFLVPSLAKRIAAASRGAALELRDADAVRDIASADWVSETCARLALSDAVGIVNCGTGRGHTVADIATRLAHAMGREDIRWNPDTNSGDSRRELVADVTRLTTFLGQEPAHDLDLALSDFAAGRAAAEE